MKKISKNLIYAVKNAIFFIGIPFLIFYIMECFLRNPWDEKWGIKLPLLIINAIFFELVAVFLFAVTGSLRKALYTEGILFFILGIAEYYIQRFRGKPFLPWDIYSLSTAASVANNYDYTLDARGIKVCIAFIVLFIVIFFANLKLPKWKNEKKIIISRIFLIILPILLIFPYAAFCQSASTIKKYRVYDKLFTPTTMTWRDGTVFAFVYELQFMTVNKPAGYDQSKEAETLTKIAENTSVSTNDLPNIIVIMDEAFADPKVLGDFTTNQDYMPFIHSLQNNAENTITGYMNASIVGGNTPNTEFEFLTGDSLAFLPEGCIPYQQFVKSKIDSMPTYLKSLGYDTLAMHPYKSTGWDRDRVYPLIGFDDMHFVDYFEERNPQYVRNYISDECLFEQIETEYENHKKNSDAPFFSFNVTMQNHSEYSGELVNFEPDISIDGVSEDASITRYLSLEHITDTAFENMVNYFKNVDDKTIIVFFGDHQAADHVVEPIWNLNGKKGSDLSYEDMTKRYKVPFVIWANYDIDEASGVETSANYLGNLTLKTAGIPLDPYRAYIDEFSKKYPVLTSIHVVDSEGNDASVNDSDSNDELGDYRRMQYYELFDDKDSLN